MTKPTPKNRFPRINWKWMLFMTIFIIVCLELFGRVYLTYVLKKSTQPKFRFNSYRIYEHVPGFHEGDGQRDWIVINNQGFRRTTDVSKPKPENTTRIFLLGGSAAHGISSAPPYPVVHVYPEETIDAHLESMLSQKYPDRRFEVINAAVTGYQVYQHTPYLLSEIIHYDPDLVIFNDGANDHYINNPEYDYYKDNRYQYWNKRLQHPSVIGTTDYFVHWLATFSAFARAFEAWHMNKDAEKYYDAEKYEQMIMDYPDDVTLVKNHRISAEKTFLKSIKTNIQLLQSEDIDVLITHQGELALRDTTMLSAAEKSFLRPSANMQKLYPVVIEELDTLCAQFDVEFVDLIPAFNDPGQKGNQLFIDYCHLNNDGGRITAEAILPAVEKILHLTGVTDTLTVKQ